MKNYSPNNYVNIQSFVSDLTVDDLKEMFSSSTFYKGKDYYDNGQVKSVKFEAGGEKLVASVQGSQRYLVSAGLSTGRIRDKCSCPLGGGCKHLVAALLFAVLEKDTFGGTRLDEKNKMIRSYFDSLPPNELVDLVIKYAPEPFLTEIANKFSGSSEAKKTFKKVEKAIFDLLDDIDYGDAPDEVSSELGNQAAKLIGLEKHLQSELSGFIVSVIEKIDESQREGYLYDDYTDDCFECPEEFTNLAKAYVKSLPGSEKTSFLRQLDALISDLSYTGFDDLESLTENIFDVNELPEMKEYFIQNLQNFSSNLAEKYFTQLHGIMTLAEKEQVLKYLKDYYPNRLIELSEYYLSNGRKTESLQLVADWTSNHKNLRSEDVYYHYIDLVKTNDTMLEKVCTEAITNCPINKMLQKIAKTITGNTSPYEKVLEEKNPSELLDFLENKGRLQEGLTLIKRSRGFWGDRVLNFYRKHKKVFREESLEFFSKMIKDNLQNTGDNFYAAIVEAIEQIRQIDPVLADKFISEIRINYHRRRNLMAMLSKF